MGRPVSFETAVKKTLAHEGGYVNDVHDSGGETKFGISKRQYPDIDIKNLTELEAISIYKKDYWDPYHFDKLKDQEVADKMFDMAVLVGPKTAISLMQKAIWYYDPTIVVDGILGPITLKAINTFIDHILEDYDTELCDHFLKVVTNNPKNQIYLHGWLERVDS